MAHDVFISHAHKDKSIADAICEKLESAQVRCWIAERDISAGEDWTEATRQAIGSSRVLVLVLSENANAAPHIEREIAHAFYTKRPIVPVRLSKTLPRRDFLFYLGNIPWFDAVSPPAEEHLEALTASINQIVRGRPVNPNPRPAESLSRNKARIDFSDSWFGALRASHYQTLAILKWTGIAVSLFGVVWVSLVRAPASEGWNVIGGSSPTDTPRFSRCHFDSVDPSDRRCTGDESNINFFSFWLVGEAGRRCDARS